MKCCRRVIKNTINQNVEIGDTQSICLDLFDKVEGGCDNSLKILGTKTEIQ